MLSNHRAGGNVLGRRRQALRACPDQHDIGAAKAADAGNDGEVGTSEASLRLGMQSRFDGPAAFTDFMARDIVRNVALLKAAKFEPE